MATTVSLEQHEKNLNTVLKLDALLSIGGAAAGAIIMGRIGGGSTVLNGAWAGLLSTNLALWGVVALRGVWAGLNGRLPLDLVAQPQAEVAQGAADVEVTRHMENALSAAPAATTEQKHEEELELVA